MKRDDVSQIISNINDKYINEAAVFVSENSKEKLKLIHENEKFPYRIRRGIIAAAIALIMILGPVAYAVAAEAKEYREAVAFFEVNGLSAEGLSRSEVKAVYRDITEKRFSYGKTAEVIQQAVPGWEISQNEPTPEELAEFWDKNVWMNSVSSTGTSYRIDEQYVYDQQKGFEVFDKGILECYRDGQMIWTAEFHDFYLAGYSFSKGRTMVWGQNAVYSSTDKIYAWIACVDSEGNVLWQKRLDHDFENEYVASILSNDDDTWAVISRGDLKYLCLSYYDDEGNELSFCNKSEVGNLGIWNTAHLGDGYIIQLGNATTKDTALIYMMDHDGNVTDSFSYEADDCEYYITDLTEFGGKVYLSAYAVPKQADEGGRHEIANIIDYVISKGIGEVSSEELTPVVKENYTAVLLVCDPESWFPKTFYSVKGSLGSKLSINQSGLLEWNVESITSTFFSPATSSFTIGGSCSVFCYTFDEEGNLTDQTDTGVTVPYRR